MPPGAPGRRQSRADTWILARGDPCQTPDCTAVRERTSRPKPWAGGSSRRKLTRGRSGEQVSSGLAHVLLRVRL